MGRPWKLLFRLLSLLAACTSCHILVMFFFFFSFVFSGYNYLQVSLVRTLGCSVLSFCFRKGSAEMISIQETTAIYWTCLRNLNWQHNQTCDFKQQVHRIYNTRKSTAMLFGR